MSAKSLFVFLAVLSVVALLGFGLLSKGRDSLAVGDAAPDKELERLDGAGTGAISDYRGQWVLVNFWASWCEPCRDEAPALEEFQRRHGGGDFTVLGIDLDDASDDARAFVETHGLTYPQLRDGDGEGQRDAYGMTGFPESFLIDPEGRVALIRRGPVDAEFLTRFVEPELPGGEGSQ